MAGCNTSVHVKEGLKQLYCERGKFEKMDEKKLTRWRNWHDDKKNDKDYQKRNRSINVEFERDIWVELLLYVCLY